MSKITPPPAMTDEQVESLWNWADEKADWHPCVDFAQAIQSARDQQWQDMLAQQEPQCPHGSWIDCAICEKPAAPVAQQAVPAGCKVVPVEPTQEMCKAAVIYANGNAVYKNVAAAALEIEEGIYGEAYTAMLAAAPEAPAQAKEISPEFTDTARAALLWVLWHHQGGSSDVGQPIRFALGMGQYEKMNAHQVREAKRWAALNPKPTHEAPTQASAVDERDREDAERYRWLRDALVSDDPFGLLEKAFGHLDKDVKPTAEDFDAGISAALAQKGGAA